LFEISTAAPDQSSAPVLLPGTPEAMAVMTTERSLKSVTVAAVVVAALLLRADAFVGAQNSKSDPKSDDELQIGQQGFEELKAKGEIVATSPLVDLLNPIAAAITKTAQPRYNHPFKFYLVHEPQPNAFATPGGYVYVTDSLLYFVKNTEQLAGTICHEVSHTIHHDSMTLIEKERQIARREIGAAVLLGPTKAHMLAIALIGKMRSLGYSRDVEAAADKTGAEVCAASAYNPWGLVWLFQDFQAADTTPVPQLLSDHPGNQQRVEALKQQFKSNPNVFGSFRSDPQSATPFTAPKNAPIVFVR
jgi:predicted Zn-dependent protease